MADTGANLVSTQEQQASQQDNVVLHVDVMFSLLSEGQLADRNGDYTYKNLCDKVHLLHERRWESGPYKEHVLEPGSNIIIDCSDLSYSRVTQRVVDYAELKAKLDETIGRIKRYLDSKITKSIAQGEVHFYIHSFSPLEPLGFALSEAFGRTLDGDKSRFTEDDYRLLAYGGECAEKFSQYRIGGRKLTVDYGSVWEHKLLSARQMPYLSKGDVERMLFLMDKCLGGDREVKGEYENYTFHWFRMKGLDGNWYYFSRSRLEEMHDYDRYGMSEEEFLRQKRQKEKKRDVATLHMTLGIGSLFFMPLALVDAGVHVVEGLIDGNLKNHALDIGVDVLCYVVARGAGYAVFKAVAAGETKTAAATVETLEAAKAATEVADVAAAEKNLARAQAELNAAGKATRNAEAEATSWTSKAKEATGKRKSKVYAKNAARSEAVAADARAAEALKKEEVASAREAVDLAKAQQAKVDSIDSEILRTNELAAQNIAKAKTEFKQDVVTFKTGLKDIYSVNDMKTLWNAGVLGKAGAIGVGANTLFGQGYLMKGEVEGMTTIYDTMQYNSK